MELLGGSLLESWNPSTEIVVLAGLPPAAAPNCCNCRCRSSGSSANDCSCLPEMVCDSPVPCELGAVCSSALTSTPIATVSGFNTNCTSPGCGSFNCISPAAKPSALTVTLWVPSLRQEKRNRPSPPLVRTVPSSRVSFAPGTRAMVLSRTVPVRMAPCALWQVVSAGGPVSALARAEGSASAASAAAGKRHFIADPFGEKQVNV